MTFEDYQFSKSDIIFYISNVIRNCKWKSFYKLFHRHVRRPWSRKILLTQSPSGYGLEVGCGCWSIAPATRTIFSDAYQEHAGSESLARVFFDTNQIPYENNSFEFVVSEHVLEHIFQPIQALKEWKRVLKTNGKIFLFLPHSDRTFDQNRKKTTLEELKKRSNANPFNQKQEILHDWIVNVIQKGYADHYQGYTGNEMLQKGLIHYNVWTPDCIVTLLKHLGLKILGSYDVVPDRKDSFLVICQKTE